MDPATFQSLLSQLDKEHFADGKQSVLTSYQQHYVNGSQVVQILKKFNFPSDQEEALRTLSARMCSITGVEGKAIVQCFVHADDKVSAVEIIANKINDPINKYTVLDAIVHHFDKEKCRKILDKVGSVPQCPPPTQYGGYPQQAQPRADPQYTGGQSGQMTINMGFPGMNVQSSFPATQGGTAFNPPPQGGAGPYPPPQGGAGPYPPPQGGPGTYPPPQGGPGTYPPPQGGPGPYPPPQGGISVTTVSQGPPPPQFGGFPQQPQTSLHSTGGQSEQITLKMGLPGISVKTKTGFPSAEGGISFNFP